MEDASRQIAGRRQNGEFAVKLSRLSDIEDKGVVPSIFKPFGTRQY